MAKQVFKNSRLFAVGTDLTGASNKIEMDDTFEEKDVTTFLSGAKEVIAGLESGKITASGFWEAGDPSKVDDAMWAARGGVGPWTIVPGNTANPGDLAYLTRALTGNYKPVSGSPGDVMPWSADASSSWPTARGMILHPPGTPRTATGTGTGQQLGAVTGGHALYVCLHVLSVADAAASLTVAVESAADSGFTAPTTRATFTAAQVISGQVAQVLGPITDTYYRAKWTIAGGTTPSFLFVVSAGIA